MADLRGALPGGPNSFNFMQFLGKYEKIVCCRAPGSWRPLLGEILDPPLVKKLSMANLCPPYWIPVLATFLSCCVLFSQLKEPFGGSVRTQEVPICGGNPTTTRERHIYLSDSHAVDIRVITGSQQNNPRFLIKYESKLTREFTALTNLKEPPWIKIFRFNWP